jgi:hypothetical protein
MKKEVALLLKLLAISNRETGTGSKTSKAIRVELRARNHRGGLRGAK